MSRIDDFSKAGQALAETKRTSVAQAQSRYDFDIAAEYGYQYAVDKACEWLNTHSETDYFELIPDANYCGAGKLNKKKMIDDFRKGMCNG